MTSLAHCFAYVQGTLFPQLAATLDEPLTAQHGELIWVLTALRVEEVIDGPYRWHRIGVVPHDRRKLARAFLVKAWLGLAQTKDLRDRLRVDRTLRTLCGWQAGERLPSESTFSRAFAAFARTGVLDRLHALRVQEYLADGVTLHVCRDSTAIAAREAQPPRPPAPAQPKRPRGRPKGGGVPRGPQPERRLIRQLTQPIEEAIAELPTPCGMGAKRHSCGLVTAWRGYKFHVDVTDEGIPVAALTTSASVNDNQVAIPLMRLSSSRLRYCYELMDCGYQGPEIRQVAEQLGHVAIVAPRGNRHGVKVPLAPDRQRHYRARTAVERFYSQFKDGGDTLCHPLTQVQPFAAQVTSCGARVHWVTSITRSKFAKPPVPAKEYSADGRQWFPLPQGIAVYSSTHALVCGILIIREWNLDLQEYSVAVGPKIGTPLTEYVRFHVDKVCASHKSNANGTFSSQQSLQRISFMAELLPPYAVQLRY
ncbi:MAG: transposase [Armatimonadota bacterium]